MYTHFDPRSPKRSKPFFPFFRASIRFNFCPVFPFLLFGRQRVAEWKGLGFLANCQLPVACFQRSSNYCFSSLKGNNVIYRLFASESSANLGIFNHEQNKLQSTMLQSRLGGTAGNSPVTFPSPGEPG
jgi:hypothetical protein